MQTMNLKMKEVQKRNCNLCESKDEYDQEEY